MSNEKKPRVDESNVHYRTIKESWNAEEWWPWFKKTLVDKGDKEAMQQVGKLVRETMLKELHLAEELHKLMVSHESKLGDYARLIADRGISAASLWFLGSLVKGESAEQLIETAMRERQRVASQARYAKDKKQLAKAEVRQLWTLWQSDPSRYPSRAAFARDMLDKFEDLTSVATVQDWTREWEKKSAD